MRTKYAYMHDSVAGLLEAFDCVIYMHVLRVPGFNISPVYLHYDVDKCCGQSEAWSQYGLVWVHK